MQIRLLARIKISVSSFIGQEFNRHRKNNILVVLQLRINLKMLLNILEQKTVSNFSFNFVVILWDQNTDLDQILYM